MSGEVIVVGAGHNGLVAALELARAGRRVLVLEASATVGGLCASREFHPGYRAPGVLHDTAGFRRRIADRLGLAAHGLRFREVEPPLLASGGEGPGFLLAADPSDRRGGPSGLPRQDADRYGEWRQWLHRVRGFVRAQLDSPPPALDLGSTGNILRLARRGLALRRLGRDTMSELMRTVPMCAGDWLSDWFESPLLGEALALPAVLGTFTGPWSPGNAANLLIAACSADRSVHGGPAAVARALAAACRQRGVEVCTGVRVARILTRHDRVVGVATASGDEIPATVVAAACDPKHTLLGLLAPGTLQVDDEAAAASFRCRGTTAVVHLALDGPLRFRGREDAVIEHARIGGGSLDALEQAFDAVKYRRFSPQPALDVRVPTVADPSLAPPGHHVVTILASFAPHDPDGGWDDARRAALADAVLERLAAAAPGAGERIVGRAVLTPQDLDRELGLSGGHLHHGEHALDQLFCLRPLARCAGYATPIAGLYLCGSGSHPGGGVTGVPGMLAARTILAAANAGGNG